jgi:hypothetical protein
LSYKGVDTFKGQPCFKIEFSNGKQLYVIPTGASLRIVDEDGKYNKLFRWEYEGPRNGIGTFCSVCAEDEKEAMRLVRRFLVSEEPKSLLFPQNSSFREETRVLSN